MNQKFFRSTLAAATLVLMGLSFSAPSFAQEVEQDNSDMISMDQNSSSLSDEQDMQTYDFRGGRGGGGRDDRGGHGGGGGDHSWHFVGCGRRSKCDEMANRSGFREGYAGIDVNLCPHDNACYGRN